MVKTFENSSDAGLNLPVGDETPEQQVALLEAMVAGMHQDMLDKDRTIEHLQTELAEQGPERAGNASALSQLRSLNEEKDQQILRLETALASTEETLFQRASDAEDRGQYLQAVVSEKEQKIEQLQAALEAMSHAPPTVDIMAQEAEETAERNLKRALEAEERTMQLASMVDEKSQIVSRLEAEVVLLKKAVAVGGDAGAQSQSSADTEARVQHLQVLVDAKDRQITQLEHLLQGMQEEASMRRSASLNQESAPHLQVMLEQTDVEIKKLSEDLNQAKKRAEIAEAGRQDLRKELASSTEEVVRLQVALDGKDVHMAQVVEDEKRTSGAHRQVIEAEVSRLQTFIAEKDRLIEQLMAAVAANGTENHDSKTAEVAQLTRSFEQEVAHLSKSFEEERAALRNQMTLHFEQEYGALRGQVKQLRREAEAALSERDATAAELRQVVAQYEQRLLAGEAASERGSMEADYGMLPAGMAMGVAHLEAGRGTPVMLPRGQPPHHPAPGRQPMPEGPAIWQAQEAQVPFVRLPVAWHAESAPQPRPRTPRGSVREVGVLKPDMASVPQVQGSQQRAASPPAAHRAASPMAAQRAASPPAAHRAASPMAQQRAASPMARHRAASPMPGLRAASPVSGPRAAWGEVPRQLTAPAPFRGFLPGSMDDAFPFGAVPGGMPESMLAAGAGSTRVAASTSTAGSLAAPPMKTAGSMVPTPGGSMSFPPAKVSRAVPVAGGSMALPPQQVLEVEAPLPVFPSIAFQQGGEAGAQVPARVIPPVSTPLLEDSRGAIVRGFPRDPVRQQAASPVVSPMRMRPDDNLPAAQAASQLPQHSGVPAWAMQQPIQPLADNKRSYLLPAVDEAGVPLMVRVDPPPTGGHGARIGADMSFDAMLLQEQAHALPNLPSPLRSASRGNL